MDEYDCRQTDLQVSKRLAIIYLNPERHQFYSCFQADEDEDLRGIRGGKIRGRKTICFHCGMKKKGHAEKTENL